MIGANERDRASGWGMTPDRTSARIRANSPDYRACSPTAQRQLDACAPSS
jgi:hypothetical protein